MGKHPVEPFRLRSCYQGKAGVAGEVSQDGSVGIAFRHCAAGSRSIGSETGLAPRQRALPALVRRDVAAETIVEPDSSRLTAGIVESPLRGDTHGGFGERSGETGREQSRNRAPGLLSAR
jgi:hypothetical protein